MNVLIPFRILLIVSLFAISACSYGVYFMDTTSNSVYEYQDDFYVRTVDSTMEMHYNLWSNGAAIWMSAVNLTDQVMFIITDSCYVTFEDERYYFDLTYESDEYVLQLSRIPDLSDYQIGKFFPVVPNGWKSFLSPSLPFGMKELREMDYSKTYTKEESPYQIATQVCYFRQSAAFSPTCVRDTIWVEKITLGDDSVLRRIENDDDYNKADKFYISNQTGYE